MKQRLLRVSMVAALALGMGAVVAAPGGAAAPSQKCAKVTGSATLSPGISSTAKTQTAKATGKLASCTGAGKTGGSGTLTATLKIKASNCTSLVGGGSKFTGTAKTTWKNKKTSSYSLTFTTGKGAAKATTATIAGKVTAGLFKGHKVSGAVKFTPKKGQNCLTVPVKNLTFVQAKAFQIA